jgi:hypothetical protein
MGSMKIGQTGVVWVLCRHFLLPVVILLVFISRRAMGCTGKFVAGGDTLMKV